MTQIRTLTRLVRFVPILSSLAALLLTVSAGSAVAQDGSAAGTRYGLFGLLDHRSQYGHYWFPEPLTLGETDVDNEVRFDWVHTEGHGHVNDELTVELEKSFGLTTFELEIPYEWDRETTTDEITGKPSRSHTRGVGNIELSLRRPIYQFVSRDGFFDNTIGAGIELGIPSNSPVSQHTEVVAKMFDSLRLGQNFSLQGVAGYSVLIGPGEEGGNRTFEYGLSAGYNLNRQVLGLPFVEQLVPIFELKGETGLNNGLAGKNSLSGTVGMRASFDPIGSLQPRLGVGYIFPIDKGARDEFKWGVVTSLVFEY